MAEKFWYLWTNFRLKKKKKKKSLDAKKERRFQVLMLYICCNLPLVHERRVKKQGGGERKQ